MQSPSNESGLFEPSSSTKVLCI